LDPKLPRSAPILKWSCIYSALSVGAALLISISFFLGFQRSAPVHSHRFEIGLGCLALCMSAAAIFYGIRIAKQASIEARLSEQLVQEAKQRATEIAALYETSKEISSQLDLPSLLQTIVERARSLLATSGGAIFLFDEDSEDFVIAGEVGVGTPVGTHLPLHEGLAGRVAETLEPMIVNNYANCPYRSKALRQLPISAAVCVPMVRGGELIGALGVHEVGEMNRRFTEADARLLSVFADNAAGAVYNTRLMDALRRSKERFRIAAECASDIVYDWDLLVEHANYFGAVFKRARRGTATFPVTREEYWSRVHPEDRARVQAALADHIENGTPFSEEYRILDEYGSYIIIADRGTAIRNSQGTPVKLIGAVSNITERKQAEQMKSDFVSFVTHQLRTPLSGVKWMLELATDGAGSLEEMRSFVHDARTSVDRLIGLVNDLLNLSRLERGKLQIAYQSINLTDLTRGVIDELAPVMSEKELALSVQPEDGLPVLSSDPQLLRQVVLNLVSNAMKYTPSGGQIGIRISHDASHIRWEIRDTGIGIPKADQGMLFEKFFRAGNALAVETEGTGLGLYLVQLVLKRLGGSIECHSEEGLGSKFEFKLPLLT